MSKDSYRKRKIKEYFEKNGYMVEYLEISRRIYDRKNDRVFFAKFDIFHSDLIAMNENEVIFLQVKSNRSNISGAVKKMKKMKRPRCKCVKFYVALWERGKLELIDIDEVMEIEK